MRWRVSVGALCTLLAWAQASTAAPPPAATEPDNPEAQSFFRFGAQAYDAGDYDHAILAFREAYTHAPRSGLLFSLGLAYRNRYFASGKPEDLEQAITSLRSYLANAPQGTRRKEALDALSALVPLTGPPKGTESAAPARPEDRAPTLLMVSSLTPSIALDVDTARAPRVPAVIDVTPGRHVVRGHAPGYRDEQRTVDIVGGTSLALNLDLELLPSFLRVVAPPGTSVLIDRRYEVAAATTPLALAPGQHEVVLLRRGYDAARRVVTLLPGERRTLALDLHTSTQRSLAYGSFAVGAATLTAAAVLAGLAWSKDSTASSIRDRAATRNLTQGELRSYDDALDARNRLRVASLVTASVGFAFGATGLGLFLLDSPELPGR